MRNATCDLPFSDRAMHSGGNHERTALFHAHRMVSRRPGTRHELARMGRSDRTHGATYEEAVRNGQELLEGAIAVRQADGEALPVPQVFASV